MTTITLDSPISTGRLEELVDRLLAILFRVDAEQPAPNLVRNIHQARRLRQSGDPASSAGQALDGALAMLAVVDTADASDSQLRWLYTEWLDIARRRFAGCGAMLYSPSTGRAAVLVPTAGDDGTLEVAAVLGMGWPVGKRASKRSLRGLKPLAKGGGR